MSFTKVKQISKKGIAFVLTFALVLCFAPIFASTNAYAVSVGNCFYGGDSNRTTGGFDNAQNASQTFSEDSVRHDFYVSSSGVAGATGTREDPFATIAEAYNAASTAGTYFINLMSDIEQNSPVEMDTSKKVVIASDSTASGSNIFTIKRTAVSADSMFLLDAGELTFTNVTLDGGSVANSGEALYIDEEGIANLGDGLTIKNFIRHPQYVAAGVFNFGTLNMSGTATITDNKVIGSSEGGGVVNNGIFNMSDEASIAGNTASSGGGVSNIGTFNMTGGSITNNKAVQAEDNVNGNGGGVKNTGIFNMSGTATITGNTASIGGGGVDNSAGTTTMSGGKIVSNKSEVGAGVDNSSTFNMTGGSISNNTADGNDKSYSCFGGGVNNDGTFNMSGTATIADNTASSIGGGVCNAYGFVNGKRSGIFNMSDTAAITGNQAPSGGGVRNYGTFNVSGDVNITGNTMADKTTNDNFCFSDNNPISVVDAGLDANAKIGIRAAAPQNNLAVVTGTTDTKFFTCDNEGYDIVAKGDVLVLVSKTKTTDDKKSFVVGNFEYIVVHHKGGDGVYIEARSNKVKKLAVPKTVKDKSGNVYMVTGIAAKGFKNCKKLTKVSGGKNVFEIGTKAFAGCRKLKKVTVSGKSLKTIGAKAFSGCKNLKKATFKSKNLKKIGKNAFAKTKKLTKITIKKTTKLKTVKKAFNKAGKNGGKNLTVKVKPSKMKAYKKLILKKGGNKKLKVK